MATKKTRDTSNTRLQRLAKVDDLELTRCSSRKTLINSVKQMFEKGTIRTLAAAENLIKLIQDGKMDEFDVKLKKLDIAANTKAAKRQAE